MHSNVPAKSFCEGVSDTNEGNEEDIRSKEPSDNRDVGHQVQKHDAANDVFPDECDDEASFLPISNRVELFTLRS